MERSSPTRVLVAGGAGYVGAPLCLRLAGRGLEVRALDSFLHGQHEVRELLEQGGVGVRVGDIRDAAARSDALDGVDVVVHLAAIVGDPACARDPELSHEVNVDGTHALVDDAARSGVSHFVLASTCSNYGRLADPDILATEETELAPVSLYADQKVGLEREMLDGDRWPDLDFTCLRFATVYGVAARMRFDLTVNEFTRDLWNGNDLLVFGEQFWRPYVHVEDVGLAVATVLEAPREKVAGDVFNIGSTSENYRKLDLVEIIREQISAGRVEFVHRDEDPRDYRVSFEKAREVLGYRPEMTVPDGVREVAAALDRKAFGDPYADRYRN